jgi:YNFM family putative membrane transporter
MSDETPPATGRRTVRLLQATSFTSGLDRASIAPLIVVLAKDLHESLDRVTLVATAYFLAYGLLQAVWGNVSDRFGRVRTMRLSLAIAALACLGAAIAPGLISLLVARTIAGAAFAASIPAAMVYIGDTVPLRERQGALTDLMTGTAVGTAAGTVFAAVVAEYLHWRFVFVFGAIAAAALTVLIATLPEPQRAPAAPFRAAFREVTSRRITLLILGLSMAEGFALLGFLVFFPATLQLGGASTSAAGAVTAAYGVSVMGFGFLVKTFGHRFSPATLITAGGLSAAATYTLMSLHRDLFTVLVASALLGASLPLMHSTLQTWITESGGAQRAMAVSLFATTLFTGNALGAFAGGSLIAGGHVRTAFLAALAVSIPLTLVAAVSRQRHGPVITARETPVAL